MQIPENLRTLLKLYLFQQQHITPKKLTLLLGQTAKKPLEEVLLSQKILSKKELLQILKELQDKIQKKIIELLETALIHQQKFSANHLAELRALYPHLKLEDILLEEEIFSPAQLENLMTQIRKRAFKSLKKQLRGNLSQSTLKENLFNLETKHSLLSSIGKYKVVEEISRGGMGIVYKVYHENLKQFYALKVIASGELASEKAITRFHREAKNAAKLKHPYIVQVFDSGEENGQAYFVMEYIQGETLAHFIEEGLEIRKCIVLFQKILQGVQFAHQHGILHRDLKPANIFITKDEIPIPKIGDFGLSKDITREGKTQKLTKTGNILGTPEYMPPEQVLGEHKKVKETADIYALGVCLYECLTNELPFEGGSLPILLHNIVSSDPIPPSEWSTKIDRDLETIVLKAMANDPMQRYPNAKDFAADLERFLKGSPILAKRFGLFDRFAKWSRRNKLFLSFFAIIFLSLGGIIVFQYFNDSWKTQSELKSLNNWIQVLQNKNSQKEQQKKAIKEIAKLETVESFEALVKMLQKGTRYFLEEQSRDSFQDKFFQAILTIFRKQRNQKAIPFLYDSFTQITDKLVLLAESERDTTEVLFAVNLVKTLAELNPPDLLLRIEELPLGINFYSLFWEELDSIYKKIAINSKISANKLPSFEKYLLQGKISLLQFKYKNAIKFFTLAIKEQPQSAIAFLQRGKARKLNGNLEKALEDFEKALEFYRNWDHAIFLRAEVKKSLGDYAGALKDLNFVLEIKPNLVNAYLNRAQIKGFQRKHLEAVRDYNTAIELNPKIPESYFHRGVIQFNATHLEEAKVDFLHFIEMTNKPRSELVKQMRQKVLVYFPEFATQTRNPEKQKALLINQKATEHFNRAMVKLASNQHLAALKEFDRAIQLDPSYFKYYVNRGNLKYQISDFKGAIADQTIAIQLNSQCAEAFNNRAVAKRHIGDFYGALVDYDKVLKLRPNDTQTFYNRALIKLSLNELVGALEDIEKSLKESAIDIDKFMARATILEGLGRFSEALTDYDYVLKLNSDFIGAYLMRGMLKNNRLKDMDGAIEDYNKALELNPKAYPVYFNRGIAWLNKNETKKAKLDFLQFLESTQFLKEAEIVKYRKWLLNKFPDLSEKK